MSIPNKTYEIYRGDACQFDFTVTDNIGQPILLSGWVVKFVGKLNLTDTDASAIFNIAATIRLPQSGANLGICTAVITNAMTLALPSTVSIINYMWQAVEVSGDVHTLEKGIIRVLPDITIST